MFSAFNWQQMTSAFIVLFAVIDIIGSIPIIINLKEKGKDVNALKATLISFALLIGFFYAGDLMLKLFLVKSLKTRGRLKKQRWFRWSFRYWQEREPLQLYSLCVQNMPVSILSLH